MAHSITRFCRCNRYITSVVNSIRSKAVSRGRVSTVFYMSLMETFHCLPIIIVFSARLNKTNNKCALKEGKKLFWIQRTHPQPVVNSYRSCANCLHATDKSQKGWLIINFRKSSLCTDAVCRNRFNCLKPRFTSLNENCFVCYAFV